MRCFDCDDQISDGAVRWAYDSPYCEECFDNNFNYCCRCDEVIRRDSTHYNDDGDPYCSECHEKDFDDDAPNNPDVSEADRNLVIELSRNWLNGKVEVKKLISINAKDDFLKTIREKVGYVGCALYVFGLYDREEYQISASSNIIDKVKNATQAIVTEGSGCNRLGISHSLRKNHQKEITDLIKHITQ